MGAFSAGLQAGFDRGSQAAQRKHLLSDEEFQTNLGDAQQTIKGLQDKLATLYPDTVEHLKTTNELGQAIAARTALFHPAVHPNAIQKLGEAVRQHLRDVHPDLPAAVAGGQTATQAPGIMLPAAQTPTGAPAGLGDGPGPALPAGTPFNVQQPQTLAQLKAAAQANLMAAGLPAPILSEQEQQHAARIQAGLEAPITSNTWKTIPGSKIYKDPNDGISYVSQQDATGNTRRMPVPGYVQPIASQHVRTVVMNVKGKGWSEVSFNPLDGSISSIVPGANPPRGFIPMNRHSSSVDAAGVTTSTNSQTAPAFSNVVDLQVGQQMGGSMLQAAQDAPEAGDATAGALSPGAAAAAGGPVAESPKPATLGSLRQRAKANAPAVSRQAAPATASPAQSNGKQLDATGHIPESAGGNPMIREAANQLIDGVDKDKISLPVKDRAAADLLARQFGWSQGKFTPREQNLLNESTTFLNQAMTDPSLAVLDSGESRAKLAGMLDLEKGPFISAVKSQVPLTAQESQFIQMYNQLVGSISGLGQLTRSGRITEATVNRLMSELPNPVQTRGTVDAQQRLQRLLNEIRVAQQRGAVAPGAQQGGASSASSGASSGSASGVMVFNPATGRLE